jgi:hypothetical protein
MIDVLEDSQPLENYTYDEIHDILIRDLELNPPNIHTDYYDGLKKLIQRRKR